MKKVYVLLYSCNWYECEEGQGAKCLGVFYRWRDVVREMNKQFRGKLRELTDEYGWSDVAETSKIGARSAFIKTDIEDDELWNWEIVSMKIRNVPSIKHEIGPAVQSLINDNASNLPGAAGYDKGYAEGYQDALVDVLNHFKISNTYEYFN